MKTATGVALAAALAAAAGASASPHLRAAPRLPLGYFPWGQAIAVGDFDGDGKADAAYSRELTSGVALMRGDGAGGFHAPIVTQASFPLTSQAVALHAGDFNADGRLDLAQSDFASGFFVYIGLGDGRFAQTALGGGDFYVAGSAVGDLDGDRKLDLALALWPTGAGARVLVYRGDGAGGFSSPVTWTVPSLGFPAQMAAADFDGDGRDDLAVTSLAPGGRLSVLLGTPGLSLSIRGAFDSGGAASSIALGDLNGDGRLDVAVGSVAAFGTASALLGDGTGAFALSTTVEASPAMNHVGLADLDGDGRLDLAMSGANLWVRRGDGTGHFGPPDRYGLVGAVVAAELTGDGRTDLLVGASLLAGGGAGSVDAQRAFAAGPAPRFAVADDFDRDGRPDLVVANASGAVHLLRGDGAGGFAPPAGTLYGSLPTAIAQGDFDRDGWTDVAVAYEGTSDVVVLRNDRAGGWTARSFPAGGVPRLLAVGDFGGDGIADIAVANGTSGSIDVLHGLPDGTFVAGGSTPVGGQPVALVAGRFNSDDRLDLVFSRMREPNAPTASVLVGTGLETFVPGPEPELPLHSFPGALLAGDLDGDGRLDLAGAGDSQQNGGLGGLGVFLGRGDGRFDPVIVQPPVPVAALAAADVTLDGRPDLAVLPDDGGALRGTAQLFVGTAGGGFAWSGEPSVPVGKRGSTILTHDLDRDGRPDVVVVVEDANAVTVLRGRAPAAGADLSVSIAAGPDPVALGVPFHYRVTAVNQGPSAAEGVRLRFVMPFGLTVLASSPGSPTCTPAANVYTCDLPALASGASFAFDADVLYPPPTLAKGETGTPPELPGQAFGWASVTALTPGDPSPADNLATSYVSVGPIDLTLQISDSVDPVSPGQPYRYRFSVTNAGAYPASRVFVGTQLPPGVTLVRSGPGCLSLPGHIDCYAAVLPAGETVSFDVDVLASPYTSVAIEAQADANEWDLSPQDNTAREETTTGFGLPAELTHGSTHRGSLPPGDPAQRTFTVLVPPHASFEVVLDEASGDYGNGATGAALDRLASDTSTVLQAGLAAGTGGSRVLRWQNTTVEPQRQMVRLRSRGCTTDCGPDDGYRLRAYETTAAFARFNTTGGQTTILLVQNPGAAAVAGTLWFAEADGQPAGSRPFFLSPRAVLVLNVATLLPGRSGAITLTHDAGYGGLAAKAIAIEPANGTSYDTVLQYRPR